MKGQILFCLIKCYSSQSDPRLLKEVGDLIIVNLNKKYSSGVVPHLHLKPSE